MKSKSLMDDMPEPVADVESGLKVIEEYGFCVHKRMLNPEQVQIARDRLDEQARLERDQQVATLGNQSRTGKTWIGGTATNQAIPSWQGVNMLPNKGREFIDLLLHPIPRAYCQGIFGNPNFHLGSSTGLILRKGAEPMVVHCDQQYIPLMTDRPLLVNFMICLTDFTEAMGATRVIPRSHKFDHFPTVSGNANGAFNPEPYETVPVLCEAGDVIVFESRVWHQSGQHNSDNTRYSITTFWCQSWLKPMDDYVQSLHDDVYRSLKPDELEVLGFRTDTCGRFEPRQPNDRQSTNRKMPFVPELRPDSIVRAVPVADMDESKVFGGAKSMGRKS